MAESGVMETAMVGVEAKNKQIHTLIFIITSFLM